LVHPAECAKEQGKVRFVGFTGHKDSGGFGEMLRHGDMRNLWERRRPGGHNELFKMT
jgi:predicted aldo/keto reductase-like oxidoreductase